MAGHLEKKIKTHPKNQNQHVRSNDILGLVIAQSLVIAQKCHTSAVKAATLHKKSESRRTYDKITHNVDLVAYLDYTTQQQINSRN